MPPVLYTDVWSGPVTVSLEFTQTEPVPPAENFDVAVETSVLVHGGRFGLRGTEDPPNLVDEHGVDVPPGWLRMRASAGGRGIASDEAVSTPVEHYVVQVWPETPSPTKNLTTGEQVHGSVPAGLTSDAGVTVEPVVIGSNPAMRAAGAPPTRPHRRG